VKRGAALVALALALAGCATKGTLAELGRPDFDDAAPGERFELVEPQLPGQLHAKAAGSGDGDYRSETRMLVAPFRDGDEVVFDLNARPRGDQRIVLLEVLVYPIAAKDVLRYKQTGKLPEGAHPIARVRADKKVPGREHHHVDVRFKATEAAGFDQLAVPILVRFEDGWVTIIDTVVLVPR
jgi:hypothetical protein